MTKMPAKARFQLRKVVVEVAPGHGLRNAIRWWANRSQRSATRRAIAVLARRGEIFRRGRLGRRRLYHLAAAELNVVISMAVSNELRRRGDPPAAGRAL